MIYTDPLYGIVELPDFVAEIAHTTQMRRLRGITQDALPNVFFPTGASFPSRFQHSMGVAYLATIATSQNPQLSGVQQNLIIASALLHDVGNPPFSHLAEPFLRKITGHDGESFARNILVNSSLETTCRGFGCGADSKSIISMITGACGLFSHIIRGSLDVDNLDNVARYLHTTGMPGIFDPEAIAASFRRTPSTHKIVPHTWGLIDGIQRETDKWRQARNAVYRDIYADPHLNVAMMLYRIVDLTYRAGKLESDFFLLDDADALVWLRERGQKELFAMLDSWRWYPEIYRAEIETPSARLITASRDPMLRGTLADLIAEHCNIAPHQVCIYAGEGRDDRVVDLPFLKDDGSVVQTREKKRRLWRVTIYLDPDCVRITPNAINLIKTYLDIS